MTKKAQATPDTYRRIFDFFNAPVMHLDCGQKCAPFHDGSPACCDTQNAIPIMQRSEWNYFKPRTKMWHSLKPYDAASREIIDGISSSCKAVECRGPKHCERDNRSLACRTFPFFPYLSNKGEILGLSYMWQFEHACWVISNMALVEQPFIDQFLAAYEILFADDAEERRVFIDHSASMRRVFSRRKQPIPLIDRSGAFHLILPKGGGMRPATAADLPVFAPFTSGGA